MFLVKHLHRLKAQVAQSVEQKTENLRVGSSILSLGTMPFNGGLMQNDKLFDKRIVNRNIKQKLIVQKDLDSFKKGLDDDTSKLEIIKVDTDDNSDMPTTEDYKD